MAFLPVAIKKLNGLIENPRFVRVVSVERENIKIEFDDGKLCEIDNWGRVTWLTERLDLNPELATQKAED